MANQEKPVDKSQALVPTTSTRPPVNWQEMFELGGAALLVARGLFVEAQKTAALAHIRAEFQRESEKDSDLGEKLREFDPAHYSLLFDLAAAAYLDQPLPSEIEEPGQQASNARERVTQAMGKATRRGIRLADVGSRKVSAKVIGFETHLKAVNQGIDITPFLGLAADLGVKAFENRDQHAPQS